MISASGYFARIALATGIRLPALKATTTGRPVASCRLAAVA